MKKFPTIPFQIKSNQYGFPCKTYYYITDKYGLIYHHKDKVWRKKCLMEMTTFYFKSRESAEIALYNIFNNSLGIARVIMPTVNGFETLPERLSKMEQLNWIAS